MPKGEFVKDLFKAFNQNDYKSFKEIAEKIVEDEKSKSHYNLANSLQDIVNSFSDKNIVDNNFSQSLDKDYFVSLPMMKRVDQI
jgi:hypothetical protein